MKSADKSLSREIRFAKSLFRDLPHSVLSQLKELLQNHGLSVTNGEVIYFQNRWYVTHPGLIRLSTRRNCAGIHSRPILKSCIPAESRWVFRAVVFKSRSCKGFVGYGDADPSNVSPLVHGAEMRVAETRAVNRALRKAYGIGICSVEEIGLFAGPVQTKPGTSSETRKLPPSSANGNGNSRNGTRVRDRLCQIIRQHQLDATLVKSYAVDFCGTKTLREATRDQVENFVVHLADWAEKDRNALLCQLNSYLRPQAGAA
jgi:hypothetical protein